MQTPRFISHYLTAESFQKWLETQICPYQHNIEHLHTWETE